MMILEPSGESMASERFALETQEVAPPRRPPGTGAVMATDTGRRRTAMRSDSHLHRRCFVAARKLYASALQAVPEQIPIIFVIISRV
jgi:hypothetical protein